MLLKDCTCPRLPCVKGGGTELAVTEGFSVDVWQKLPQSYGQLPQEGADSYLRLPFRGGGTELAVTEGL